VTEPGRPPAVQNEGLAVGNDAPGRADHTELDERPGLRGVLGRGLLILAVFGGLGPLIGGLLVVLLGLPVLQFVNLRHGFPSDQGSHPFLFVVRAVFALFASIEAILFLLVNPIISLLFLMTSYALGAIPAVLTGLILYAWQLLFRPAGRVLAALAGAGTSYATTMLGFGGPMDSSSFQNVGPNLFGVVFVLAGALSALACWRIAGGMASR